MNTTQRDDFAGILGGKEYGKLIQAIPHLLQFEDTIALQAAESLKAVNSPIILDMGCGEGMTTIALCQHIRGATIVGLDVAPKMLVEYKTKVTDSSNPVIANSDNRIDRECGDALSFLKKCGTGSFDAVVSGFMLHNIQKTERAAIIAEVYRVLRPGGRFVNGDKIAHDDEAAHQNAIMEQYGLIINANRTAKDDAYWLGWIEHYVRDNQPDVKFTEKEIFTILTTVRFADARLVARMRMEAVLIADKL